MRKDDGFTLIELLVVIAIIAILAAILFPLFAAAKERGRVTKCLYNLKNLSLAFRLYADDNGGQLPMSYIGWTVSEKDWCGCVNPGYADGVKLDQGAIWNYCGRNRAIFLCPTDANLLTTSWNMRTKSRDYPISYSMNWMLGAGLRTPPGRVACGTVRHPTRVMLLIHEGRDKIDDGCFYWFKDNHNGLNLPTNIHYDGSTLVYLDGHAKWASYKALLAEQDSGAWNPTQ